MLLLFLLLSVDSGLAQCNRNTGPAGSVGCLEIPMYYTPGKYQWATCLTDAYMKQKSSQRHRCRIRTATYCWYQCMLEVYGRSSGDVWGQCLCNPQGPTPTESLPEWCYSPSGDSCKWYRECLERRYPCEDTTNAYAIRYAEKFCRLYDGNYGSFTTKGKAWIDAVRKCLQVSLVPLLRPWNEVSCQELRAKAFTSHTPCYLSPDKGAPSVCDLPLNDFLYIFWTVKGSFFDLDTLGETLKGLWNVHNLCAIKVIDDATIKLINVAKIVLKKFTSLVKRSADRIPESDLQQRFADRVCSAVAKYQRWNKGEMDWFCFTEINSTKSENDSSIINLILADRKSIGLKYNAPSNRINLNETLKILADAITEGKLPLKVDGAYVWIKSLELCNDVSCNSTTAAALSETLPKWLHRTNSGVKWYFGSAMVWSFVTSALIVLSY